MLKSIVFFTLACCVFALSAHAAVIDAPHTEDNGVSCGDCHTYSLWWQFSPSDSSASRKQIISNVCDSCHDGSTAAPFAVTHSSYTLGPLHRDTIPPWERYCTDCHTPHFQEQLLWSGTVPGNELFVVQGNIVASTLVPGSSSSTFDYLVTEAKPAWSSPADWMNKSTANRGLLLVLSSGGQENTYMVTDAVEDTPGSGTGSLTVAGNIPAEYDGASFGLFYGQYIKKQIEVDPDGDLIFTPTEVKFFDGRGGFVTDTREGICQICHGQTLHFLADTVETEHINILGASEADTLHCTFCHSHEVAFGHGSDGGSDCTTCHNSNKHVSHLNLELTCSRCHDLSNMRDAQGNIALDLATTTVCATCHHDGTDLVPEDGNQPPNRTDFKNGWSDSGYAFSCAGCHNIPPSYASSPSKPNSHTIHASSNYGCENCHFQTTTDGQAIVPAGAHTDNLYSLAPGPQVNFSYTQATNTCSNISCHNSNPAQWGASLSCLDCHQGGADLDDFDPLNSQIATIDINQWTTTGHGLDPASNYPGTGSSGAGLTCEYCHDATIGHRDPVNVFRLANTNGTEGLNGVCWSCHQTGSTGYDPDGAELTFSTINSSIKVDSYHSGARHGTGANNGGRFCWDCHDPHGDNNIVMIHDQVILRADQNTSLPETNSFADVTFTARSTGSDFADTTGPIDGICNVCHTNTGHYSATGGDGHQATTVCTSCHKHSGTATDDAFSQGSCIDCHATAQGTRRPVVGEFPVAHLNAHYGGELDPGDCTVCHDQTTHLDGIIDLFDADGNGSYRGLSVDTLVNDQDATKDISDFCASCHDADGATRLPTPLAPFGNGNTPPDIAARFTGTVQYTEWYGTAACNGYEGSKRPVNSHHDISSSDQAYSGAKLECTNCHGVHNAANDAKIADPFNTAATWSGTLNAFCLACHNGGSGPLNPGFPNDVNGPVFQLDTNPYPSSTFQEAGLPCDYDKNGLLDDETIYDCAGNCRDETTALDYVGDGWCDDGSWGYELRCDAFQNDVNDCQCEGQDCSSLGGIDSCAYTTQPWTIDFSWTHSPHGLDSKRGWQDYAQDPPAPAYELDCVACHDPHGSVSANNPAGNPYMIRDYVQGDLFIDDGCRIGTSSITCVQEQVPGTNGEVVISITGYNPTFAELCVKCHARWEQASSVSHSSCGDCLTCHSHGGKMDGMDQGGDPTDLPNLEHTMCP